MLKKIFRVRNVFLLLLALVLADLATFGYRMNSCGPGQHVIESEADAIEVAKKIAVGVEDPEFNPRFLDALSKAKNCCRTTRTRTVLLVIVWEVYLNSGDGRFANVMLSNCGDKSFSVSAST